MGCSKNGSKREVHSNTGLLKGTRKRAIVAQNFRRKEIRDKISETETKRKTGKKINKTKNWFFES